MPTKQKKNTRLTLEFDGTDFHGWQKQPGMRTVQGVLENALQAVFGEPAIAIGCGRTDAGVHAWGYVCNFLVTTGLQPSRIDRALSANLPEDVVIKKAEEVGLDFHSRFDASARRYLYRIAVEKKAIERRTVHYARCGLDADKMARAAEKLLGKHDFTSFAAAGSGEDVTRECEVSYARVKREGSIISFDIKADRFLYHMVRNMVGTLIEIGRGKLSPEQMEDILCKKDRTAAGPTAPACGLALIEVNYPER